MRLHRLDTANALRIARSILDRPAAPVSARALAQCTIAHLQAAQGELRSADRAIASVAGRRAAVAPDMPYLQLALELARGTRLALAGDLAGIDAIVADEFADLADAGDFRLGSGYLSILRAQAARLRGRTGEALRTSLQACAVLATSRIFAGLAHAERAQAHALRGEADEAAAGDGRLRRAPTRPTWRSSTRGGSRPARRCSRPAPTTCRRAIETLQPLVWRLRGDGFAGHELLALHDLVRLGQATMPIDWPDGGSRARPSRTGSPSWPRASTARCRGSWRRHARAAAAGAGADLLARRRRRSPRWA